MNWTSVLDTIERQLRRQENAFRSSGKMPSELRLERPEAPMSSAEQIRAIDLMQRHDALIAQTLEVMKRSRRASATPYGR
jgi:small-conductance mechanosensitive channel